MTKTRLFTNVGLQRDFNLKRMGTLTFDLRCSDPLNTNKTDAIVYGYRGHSGTTRCVQIMELAKDDKV